MASGGAGARVVVALCLISFAPLSLGLGCAGIFYPSISASLGISPGLLSYYTSALWISALATLPVSGKLFIRLGARACVTAACAIVSLDFIALSFANGFAWFMACGCVMGVGIATLLFLAPSTLVNGWFAKRAGLLLGVVMAFTGIGGAVWCATGGVFIELWGWAVTYRVFCVLSIVLGVIPAFLLVSDAPQAVWTDGGERGGAAMFGKGGDAPAEPSEIADGESVAQPGSSHGAVASAGGAASEARLAHAAFLDAHRHPYLPYRNDDGTITPAAPVAQLRPSVASRVARLRKTAPLPPQPQLQQPEPQGPVDHPLPTEVGVPAKYALPSGLLLLIADIAFILNFGMYIFFIIPSFVAESPAAAGSPLLGALAASFAMVGQTVLKVALGFVGDRAPAAAAIVGIAAGLVGIAVLWFFPDRAPLVLLGAMLFGAYYGVANVMMPLFTRLGFGMRDYPRIYARVSMAASLGAIVSGFLWGTVIEVKGGYAELFAGVSILLAVALWLVVVLSRRIKRHGRL